MNKEIIYLYFPQWQGAVTKKYLRNSSAFLKDKLNNIEFIEVKINDSENFEEKNNIKYYDDILTHLKRAISIIEESNPSKIFTMGGDCGVELAPVSYLNRKYDNDLAVLWLDAHGDLNTPESNLSKHFHGMPLRTLLGEGDEEIIRNLFSTIQPRQVVLIGGRDLDEPEKGYIECNNIRLITDEEFNSEIIDVLKLIQDNGYHNIYIHIDLDVLNPKLFPYSVYPTNGGISPGSVTNLLTSIKKNINLVGLSVVEYNSSDGKGSEIIKDIYCL